jgi:hypothetical protein
MRRLLLGGEVACLWSVTQHYSAYSFPVLTVATLDYPDDIAATGPEFVCRGSDTTCLILAGIPLTFVLLPRSAFWIFSGSHGFPFALDARQ